MRKRLGIVLCMLAMLVGSSVLAGAADSIASAIKDGKISGEVGAYYWTMDYGDTPKALDTQSAVIGGFMSYETAPITGITGGFGFKTVHDMSWDEESLAYFGILPDDKSSYTGMPEYYLRYAGHDTKLTVGAQYVWTPWINKSPFRITPYAYRGVSLSNSSIDKFKFNLGYLTDFMTWTDSDFSKMLAGDGGAYYAGVSYAPIKGLDANIWYYYFEDNYTIIAPQFSWDKKFTKDWNGKIDVRAAQFDSVGDDLYGSDNARLEWFDETYMFGAIATLGFKNLSLSISGQQNGNNDVPETFGNNRAVTMQINKSNRAEEKAYAAKLEYDATTRTSGGLKAYVQYGIFDTPETGDNASQDTEELEFFVSYRIKNYKGQNSVMKFLDGSEIRVRYAMEDADQDVSEYPDFLDINKKDQDTTDFRVYLKYYF